MTTPALRANSNPSRIAILLPCSYVGFSAARCWFARKKCSRARRSRAVLSIARAPTLVPLQNSLIRLFSGLTFYLLLPAAMLLFAWKAAVFPAWGSGLFAVAVAVIVSHV